MTKISFSRAALGGILGAAAAVGVAATAMANATPAADKATEPKGPCFGANGCKGQSGCAVPSGHSCHGQNSCKGKGWIEKSKSECEAMAKTDKGVRFGKGAKASEAKPAKTETAPADKAVEKPAEKK
jgi:uncharacterized membrane protein